MYQEFIVTLGKYMEALDAVQDSITEKEGLTPYLGKIEVMLDGEVCGHLVGDEFGFHYEPVQVRPT